MMNDGATVVRGGAGAPRTRPPLPEPPFLVAGLGRAGSAAVRALSDRFGAAAVSAWDENTGRAMRRLSLELERTGVGVRLGQAPPIAGVRTLIKSPGIAFDEPLIAAAAAGGVAVIDELELGWRLSRAPLVAVTGTNGKSTVAGLITAMLSATGAEVELAGNTQFGPPLSAARAPLDWIVCEVSSFQLEGCPELLPEIAVFTNLTPEHLGRHGTMVNYGACKRRLFVRDGAVVSRAVIDVDDAFGAALAAEIEERGGSVARVGFSSDANYRIDSATWGLRSARLSVVTPGGDRELITGLPGAYNARNVAAALAVGDLLELDRTATEAAIGGFGGPPGRFEHIDAGQPFEVIVDFAHTPDGFEQMLATVRAGMAASDHLIVVLGYSARPGTEMEELGRIARSHADLLVLSTSGFGGFPPLPCLGSHLRGARSASGGRLELILDRRSAIEYAVGVAEPGDVVVIPGRGALPDMLFDPRGVPVVFDDRAVARELLQSRCSLSGHAVLF